MPRRETTYQRCYEDGLRANDRVTAASIYSAAEQFVELDHSAWDWSDECDVYLIALPDTGDPPTHVVVDVRAEPVMTARRPKK